MLLIELAERTKLMVYQDHKTFCLSPNDLMRQIHSSHLLGFPLGGSCGFQLFSSVLMLMINLVGSGSVLVMRGIIRAL